MQYWSFYIHVLNETEVFVDGGMFDLRAVVRFFSCTVVRRGGLHGQFEFTGRINKNFFNERTLNS